MSRIRSVHPGLFTDEAFVGCSPEARLLLLVLGCFSDFDDNFSWHTGDIARLAGLDDAEPHLCELAAAGLIVRDGAGTGRIDFQFGHPRRRIRRWDRLRLSIFSRDGHVCRYCGWQVKQPHCDHVIPVSRGGLDDASNLVTSCPPCNLSKHAKTPEEWRS